LSDSGIIDRCRSFSARIQSESALEQACTLIEGLSVRPVEREIPA
jgi:hypothetical protein